jgi:hypothetical protein
VPTDRVDDFHSSALEKMRIKWNELSDKEISEAKELKALKHSYDNAPFNEHRTIALEKLVSAITEKEAHHFHDKAETGSELARALEKKFPELFAKKESPKEEDINPEADEMYDIESEANEETEEEEELGQTEEQEKKTEGMIHRIRRALGLE